MRDKIVFFILGAVLATIAYSVGNLNKVDADGVGRYDLLVVDELVVKELVVSESGIFHTHNKDSMIGMRVTDNIPTILISNQKKDSTV
ncbi:hypothetical protein C6499_05155 [Candidatus Poribacteria bacterium]|nr:MAG: hypothetical protein C6499_05155 [Candidatus Poribacteria bacterium]